MITLLQIEKLLNSYDAKRSHDLKANVLSGIVNPLEAFQLSLFRSNHADHKLGNLSRFQINFQRNVLTVQTYKAINMIKAVNNALSLGNVLGESLQFSLLKFVCGLKRSKEALYEHCSLLSDACSKIDKKIFINMNNILLNTVFLLGFIMDKFVATNMDESNQRKIEELKSLYDVVCLDAHCYISAHNKWSILFQTALLLNSTESIESQNLLHAYCECEKCLKSVLRSIELLYNAVVDL